MRYEYVCHLSVHAKARGGTGLLQMQFCLRVRLQEVCTGTTSCYPKFSMYICAHVRCVCVDLFALTVRLAFSISIYRMNMSAIFYFCIHLQNYLFIDFCIVYLFKYLYIYSSIYLFLWLYFSIGLFILYHLLVYQFMA